MVSTGKESLGNEDLGLGATGKYPKGKMHEQDEGELKVAMTVDEKNKRIVIDFGKPIAWIGITSSEAKMLAVALMENVSKLTRLG